MISAWQSLTVSPLRLSSSPLTQRFPGRDETKCISVRQQSSGSQLCSGAMLCQTLNLHFMERLADVLQLPCSRRCSSYSRLQQHFECTYQFPGWQRCPGPPLSSWRWWLESYVPAGCAGCVLLGYWIAGDSTWRSGRAECCHSQEAGLEVGFVQSYQNSFERLKKQVHEVVTF